MRESASTFVDNWSDLVARILGDLDLDKLAFSARALRRKRGVPDALALLRLALARGPGGLSLRDAAALAHMAPVAKLTGASLNDALRELAGSSLSKKPALSRLPRTRPGRADAVPATLHLQHRSSPRHSRRNHQDRDLQRIPRLDLLRRPGG